MRSSRAPLLILAISLFSLASPAWATAVASRAATRACSRVTAAGKPANCHVCRTRAESDAGGCDVDCALGETQGAYASHGVHYFVTSDTDNAEVPSTLNEIDAQQWQFAVPTAAPANVGDPYGNVVKAPLQTVVVPLAP